jgi:hypothetical protein
VTSRAHWPSDVSTNSIKRWRREPAGTIGIVGRAAGAGAVLIGFTIGANSVHDASLTLATVSVSRGPAVTRDRGNHHPVRITRKPARLTRRHTRRKRRHHRLRPHRLRPRLSHPLDRRKQLRVRTHPMSRRQQFRLPSRQRLRHRRRSKRSPTRLTPAARQDVRRELVEV